MKKIYQKPETKAIEINIEQTLLAGSNPQVQNCALEIVGEGYWEFD